MTADAIKDLADIAANSPDRLTRQLAASVLFQLVRNLESQLTSWKRVAESIHAALPSGRAVNEDRDGRPS